MKFKCLGSSSSGNCYLLENETECLVIEVGISFKEVKKAIDFNVSKIVGVLVSHEHGDHFKHVKEYLKSGIYIMASQGTWSTLFYEIELSEKVMRPGYWYQLGGFNITPFSVVHDAVEPIGFIIRHDEIGTMLFATDTEYIKYNFKSLNLNHIMIECNYSQKIIDERVSSGNLNKGLRDRVLISHMELETCKDFIKANMTPSLYNVCLLHLSSGNSDENLFLNEVKKLVNEDVSVTIADKGIEVNVNTVPFKEESQ